MQLAINPHNNIEAAKISALPSGEINKYEYLTGAEILSTSWSQKIEQAKFTYFSLGKVLENKQINNFMWKVFKPV